MSCFRYRWSKVSSIKFWSLGINDKLIGCGALKFLEDGHGELKSIRVAESFRKKGYGIKVINHLILEAKKLNIQKLSLETGGWKIFYLLENFLKNVDLKVVNLLIIIKKTLTCYMSLQIGHF